MEHVEMDRLLHAFLHMFDRIGEEYPQARVVQNAYSHRTGKGYPTLTEILANDDPDLIDKALQGYFSLWCPLTNSRSSFFEKGPNGTVMVRPLELVAKELGIDNAKTDSSR